MNKKAIKNNLKKNYLVPQATSLSDYGVAYGGPCRTGGSASECSTGNTAANNCQIGNNAGVRCNVGEGATNCGVGNTPI